MYGLKRSVAFTAITTFPVGLVACFFLLSALSSASCSYSALISAGVFVLWTISQPSVSSPFSPNESYMALLWGSDRTKGQMVIDNLLCKIITYPHKHVSFY